MSAAASGGRCRLTQEKLEEYKCASPVLPCKAICPDGTVCGEPYSKHISAADDEQRASKRARTAVHGLSDSSLKSMRELHSLIQSSHRQLVDFSSPSSLLLLPFPQSSEAGPLPKDRFCITHEGTFEYMGREAFQKVYNTWNELANNKSGVMMSVFGTPGYGKSHILAALTVYLLQQGRRVVYIPDCNHLVNDPVDVMRNAFVSAFIDDDVKRKEALSLVDEQQINDFSKKLLQTDERITFVADQANAFDEHPDLNESTAELNKKSAAKDLLHRCAKQHVLVCGASANNRTAKKLLHRQVGAIGEIIHLNGGFSQIELAQWQATNVHHLALGSVSPAPVVAGVHAAPAPATDDKDDWQQLVSYTGGVPLYLYLFKRVVQQRQEQNLQNPSVAADFDSCWSEYVQLPSLRIMRQQLRTAVTSMVNLQVSAPATFQSLVQFYRGCITETSVPDLSPDLYDCRFFFRAPTGGGRCLCGFVRDTVAMIMRELSPLIDWLPLADLYSAISGTSNPSVRGFLVEQACIRALLTTPVEYVSGLQFQPSQVRYFDTGSEVESFVNDQFCVLYVPRAFNYKAVDAVLRIIPSCKPAVESKCQELKADAHKQLQDHCAVIVPVQITLTTIKKHMASVAKFFAQRSVWLERLVAADGTACVDAHAQWVFLWIVPKSESITHGHHQAREQQDSVSCCTRSGKQVVVPSYTRLISAIEALTQRENLLLTPPSSPQK